jgi:hypothetical protein
MAGQRRSLPISGFVTRYLFLFVLLLCSFRLDDHSLLPNRRGGCGSHSWATGTTATSAPSWVLAPPFLLIENASTLQTNVLCQSASWALRAPTNSERRRRLGSCGSGGEMSRFLCVPDPMFAVLAPSPSF